MTARSTDEVEELRVAKAIYDECRILNQEERGGDIDRPFATLDDKEREQMCRVARAAIREMSESEALTVMREALEGAREYFNERADADLDVTGYTGNDEMRLLVMIDEALARIGRTA